MRRLLLAAFIAGVAARASALPLEWLLLTGDARERLVDILLLEERLDELDFLESVWAGDEWGAEAAARTLVDQTHDPEMTRWLAGYLRRTGRADEADRLDPPRLRKLQSAGLRASAPDVSSHRPVVFLHGYNEVRCAPRVHVSHHQDQQVAGHLHCRSPACNSHV